MFFFGNIVITDPCYIVKNGEDWELCDYGQAMDALGISTFLSTGEDDCGGSYIVYGKNGEKLGEFCSDSGVVSVMDPAELSAYNPAWAEKLGDYCYTLIPDFRGEVTIVPESPDGQPWTLRGEGNIPFRIAGR